MKLLFSSAFILCSVFVFSQQQLSSKLNAVRQFIAAEHVQPVPIDDRFSSSFFDQFLKTLDPDFLFFSTADVRMLDKFRYGLDEEINQSSLLFFHEVLKIYKSKLVTVDSLISVLASHPFDFNKEEYYHSAWDTVRPASIKLLSEKWQLLLKKEVLEMLQQQAAKLKGSGALVNKATILSKEPEARARIISKYRNRLKQLTQTDEQLVQDVSASYLNSFVRVMDPHSAYMDASENRGLQKALNSEGYYFGFTLSNTPDGEVAITHLEPGGAAWASGDIHKDDVLLSLKWSSSEPIDLGGMDAAEVSSLMDRSNTEKLELTIRKMSGETKTVVLQKQKLDNEENIVKSFLLKGEKNIGYITLPSFYTRWEQNSGSSCATDVAKEIIKLKKDNIQGLILDLRYNGGGSLQEAVEMAGIFIDEGAVCQLLTKDRKTIVLKDMNRGVIYSGPLVLLVNGYSASASELLAGSLQDYNRAIIIGSETYGKATGQEVKALPGSTPNDFVKVTNLKLYRVTGKSVQKSGVKPDINLPESNALSRFRELDEKFALDADTIGRYKYLKPLQAINTSGMQEKSTARVLQNAKFAELKNYYTGLSGATKKPIFSLKWEDAEKENSVLFSSYNENILTIPSSVFTALGSTENLKFIDSNPVATEIHKRWLARIARDPYIEESFFIMIDLIKLNGDNTKTF